jgi:hypothetical protein
MAEKSMTNAKTPNQVARTARKASGSTRKDRKAAVKSVARTAAKQTLSGKASDRIATKLNTGGWLAATDTKLVKSSADIDKINTRDRKASVAAKAKAASIGVKPKKIERAAKRATKAVSARLNKAEYVQAKRAKKQ